jgi:hypothetical protein
MTHDPLPEDWATPMFTPDELSVIAETLGEMAHLLEDLHSQENTIRTLRELQTKAASHAFNAISH